MSESSFVGYVGDEDFHDGQILAVEQLEDAFRVRVRGHSGKVFDVEFRGVHATRSRNPVGMVLYALVEYRASPPLRRFVFANWEDDNPAHLEVEALSFTVVEANAEKSEQ